MKYTVQYIINSVIVEISRAGRISKRHKLHDKALCENSSFPGNPCCRLGSLWDLLIEPVWRGARRCKLSHSDGSLFAYNAFLCITVTVSLVIRMSLSGSSEIQLPFMSK